MKTAEIGLDNERRTLVQEKNFKPLPLRVNFSWTFAGNVVYAASQWGMLVVLAKLGTPEMVGRFALGLAVTAPVIMFANLQLRAVQATDASDEYSFGEYLGLRLITTGLAFMVILGITAVSGYGRETSLVIMVLGVAKCFESVSDVIYGLLQKHERMDRIARSMIIKGPLSLTAMGVALYLTGSIAWGATALACIWLVLLLAYDIRNGIRVAGSGVRQFRPRWRRKDLVRLAKLSLPLGIVMMLISLNTNIPRYFVERYYGEQALGYFAAIAYLMVVGNMVVNALGQSASSRLARYFSEKKRPEFRKLLLGLVLIGFVLGLSGLMVMSVTGEYVLSILYGGGYAQHYALLLWIMLSCFFFYTASFLGYGITATRAFDKFLLPYAGVTVVAIAASYLLVPKYGLVGAAWSLGVTGVASCVVAILILNGENVWSE